METTKSKTLLLSSVVNLAIPKRDHRRTLCVWICKDCV